MAGTLQPQDPRNTCHLAGLWEKENQTVEWGGRQREKGDWGSWRVETAWGFLLWGCYDGMKGEGGSLWKKMESREQMFGRWRQREELTFFFF